MQYFQQCKPAMTSCRVPTGQGKLENVREFVLSGKVGQNIIFEKSGKMNLDHAKY